MKTYNTTVARGLIKVYVFAFIYFWYGSNFF